VSSDPRVSVLLPCFNAEPFVAHAVESILGQTYTALELLAVDDGSSDGTRGILEAFAQRDSRVRVIANERNRGLIPTLNAGVGEARGELLARMDADDIARRDRIERQVAALDARPDVGVVGTGVDVIDTHGKPVATSRVVRCREPGGARFMGLFATPIAHPTLLARTGLLRAHPYGLAAQSLHTEDYELFARMLADGVGFINLDQPLVTMRVSAGSVSRRHERVQVDNFVACAREHLQRTLGLDPDPATHRVLVNRMDAGIAPQHLAAGIRLLDSIEARFVEREPAAAAEIRGIADEHRVDILVQAALKGSNALRISAARLALRYRRRLLSARARRYFMLKRPRLM
jgi:glycosyltransferase involved in cell wall biosynthesis